MRTNCCKTGPRLTLFAAAQSGEKTALAIAILVSQTLYFTLVIEVRASSQQTVTRFDKLRGEL